MYPFWDTVIAPLIEAADARRIVEIGALRGETTSLMLDGLAPDSELHVIDPLPAFDPAEHERRFPGRYVFHRDLSLNVLDRCGAFDVALIDGDHNWYTVYNELQVLRESARTADVPLPLLILHDVCWPYGRRDLYYEPSQIPAEFRQPYRRRGMRRGRSELLRGGGMNEELCNAEHEGGPRNGVMTAVDDFIAEHDLPLRRVVLPFYFGLAIVTEERRLDRAPRLRALLDHLEGMQGKDELLELSEAIRLDAATWEQDVLRFRERKQERSIQRYLDLLKGAVLDEHYLENEVRIEYLIGCAERGRPANPDLVRDPTRFLRKETLQLRQARRSGLVEGDAKTAYFPYTAVGRNQLDHLERTLEAIRAEGVEGDVATCGAGRGGAAIFAHGFLAAYEIEARRVWVADTFRSTPEGAEHKPLDEGGVDDLLADLNQVREGFERFGLLDDQVRFLQGRFADTLPDAPFEQLALLHIGGNVGSEAGVALDHVYGRLAIGGYVVIEDYYDQACHDAIEAFRTRHRVVEPIERVGVRGATWRKCNPSPAPHTGRRTGESAVRERAPLAPPAPKGAIDLSVVVVFFNMRREAERTLHSLSRGYQEGIDDLAYEVIVVDNGSTGDQHLGEDFVRGFGPEFRYIEMGPTATPSPTVALNRGIRASRGKALALMIDGAHVLTPGVLRYGMVGLRSYEPALVATQQWYVGPGQQPEAVTAGYDTADEDALFRHIDWPRDGYRLFEISHFIGERDWLDGILESNCLFVPRSLLEQVGGFDDSFTMPGGGYANLELYERLGSSPDVTLTTILGEGSFHQVHGGTTTNDGGRDDRRSKVFSYGEHYRERRGRQLRGPVKAIHYVGAMASTAAWRTRARRLSAEAFTTAPVTTGVDGLPAKPALLPEELKTAFIEAYWNSLAWQHTTWLGQPVTKPPTDLVAYQELLAGVRPDWIIETGTGDGGRALFLASVCDLLGHGQVVSVDHPAAENLPHHPRVTYVTERPHGEKALERVRAVTGDTGRALVILGSRTDVQKTTEEFARYERFVPVGSYVVVEDTILNGHPVWPGFGNGPYEALRRILVKHGDFVQDAAVERYGLTFNPGGFLRRVAP
jgi:cephalosporin hydroxylase